LLHRVPRERGHEDEEQRQVAPPDDRVSQQVDALVVARKELTLKKKLDINRLCKALFLHSIEITHNCLSGLGPCVLWLDAAVHKQQQQPIIVLPF
jgi:hypothetical protein